MKKTPLEPYSVSPVEAARFMGISRSRVYDLKDAGELDWYKDGRRTLFVVSGMKARIARLMSAPPSTGSLLSSEDRKLARQRANKPPPPEEQQIAIERATEPKSPPPIDRQQFGESLAHAPAPGAQQRPTSDLAALYFERRRLLSAANDPNEAEARAFEFVVRLCCQDLGLDLESAKAMVFAAITPREAKGGGQ